MYPKITQMYCGARRVKQMCKQMCIEEHTYKEALGDHAFSSIPMMPIIT